MIVNVSTHVQHLADFVACHPGGWCQSASVQCCLFGGDGFSPHTDLWQLFCFIYEQLKDGQRLWQVQSNVLRERERETGKLRNSVDIFNISITLISHFSPWAAWTSAEVHTTLEEPNQWEQQHKGKRCQCRGFELEAEEQTLKCARNA